MTRVVIDIPDKDRRDIYWVKGKRVANLIGEYKVLAVLPEGHGDLIDRDELFTEYPEIAIEPYINAPIVIEADKENEND